MSSKNIDNPSMEQVRELLMGNHLKDIESRMKRQEKILLQEITKLRDDMQNRVNSLENFMKNEFDSLLRRLQEEKNERSSLLENECRERTEAIKSEQKEREQTFKRLDQDLAARKKEIERKFISVSSSLDAAEKGLRELVFSENTRLAQTLEERHQKVMENLTHTDSQIRHDVVSRAQISAMFAEAVIRFSDLSEEETYEEIIQMDAPPTTEKKGNSES